MRDTQYARELASAAIPLGGGEGRIERLFVKEYLQEEIRFSWWKKGRMMTRPLDLPEEDLLKLFQSAIENGIFTNGFLMRLKDML